MASNLRFALKCVLVVASTWLGIVLVNGVVNWYVHSTLGDEDWLFRWYAFTPFLCSLLSIYLPVSLAPTYRIGVGIVAIIIIVVRGALIYVGGYAAHIATDADKVLMERLLMLHVLVLLACLFWCVLVWRGKR